MKLHPLKLCRLRAGKTQLELSRETGIGENRLSKAETGRLSLRAEELGLLARALYVERELLVEGGEDAAGRR